MSETLLLVDLVGGNGTCWEQVLREYGYAVLNVHPAKVSEVCRELAPDLVLVHAAQPDHAARAVCQTIKSDPQNRLTPVLVIGAFPNAEGLSQAFASECYDMVLGPVAPQEGVSRVQFLLELKLHMDERAASSLLSLARNIESRNHNGEGHCDRVSAFAVRLGEALLLPPEQIQALALGGILHDIGKVAVPDEILFKAGPLTAEEFEIVRQHPIVGEHICAPLKSFRHVLPIIRHHHERIDGTGYPDRLAMDEIPLPARIMQIADVFDALTSERPYRQALAPRHAFGVMNEEANRGWLDGNLVRRFEESFDTGNLAPLGGWPQLPQFAIAKSEEMPLGMLVPAVGLEPTT